MNKWTILESHQKYKNAWIEVVESKVITPNGKEGVYTLVETKPFVVVIACSGDKLLMVRQQRFSINKETLEFPAGGIEDGEDILQAAKRELKEETGFEASSWTSLGHFDDAVGIARHKGYVFLAENLNQTNENKMADDGISKYELIEANDLEKMISDNTIADPKVIAAFCKIRLIDNRI